MLATRGRLPPAVDDDDWAYEMKWDGVRTLAYVEPGSPDRLRLLTRSARVVTASYPELAELVALVDVPVVLDGEVVALDARGRPSFGALQPRIHLAAPSAAVLASRPVAYLVFDLLRRAGTDLLDQPWTRRRQALEALGLSSPHVQVPPVFLGAGQDAWAVAAAQGLEGVVAKRRGSRYEPGRRSPAWVKVKRVRTQEVVIGGWQPGQGSRSATIGSLLLGLPGPQGLAYVGHVGTGFTVAALHALAALLAPTERAGSPFATPVPPAQARVARWVEPRLVGEVAFTEWTRDERLRHPVWRGLRADKSPGDVVRES